MKRLAVTSETRAAVVRETAERLLAGGVALIPTDTVYGLAALPAHSVAVARICTLKGRLAGKPIALLAADLTAVERHGGVFTADARRLAGRFWPGALTLVLPCGDQQEGFRVPDHPLTREILAACGGVLRVTSANRSGQGPAATAAQALSDLGVDVDIVIDDGECPGGVPSSVVRVNAGGLEILRAGAVPESDVLAAVAAPAAAAAAG